MDDVKPKITKSSKTPPFSRLQIILLPERKRSKEAG